MAVITLRSEGPNSSVEVDVDLGAGGRLARITVIGNGRDAEKVELLADPPDDRQAWSSGWGSFPMAPWAGRIRHGRFTADGHRVALDRNHRDGSGTGGGPVHPPIPSGEPDPEGLDDRLHAIHGTVFTRPWTLDSSSDTRCEIRAPIAGELGWPFGGVARQRIEVTPTSVRCLLSAECGPDDPTPFPATIGWHPWFTRPDRLEMAPSWMYELDAIGLPTGELVPPSDGPWDDCFVNDGPVRLVTDRPVAPIVTITSDCDHLVVFDRPQHAVCVEPQSGPPDAVNLGRHDFARPGHPLTRTMTISW